MSLIKQWKSLFLAGLFVTSSYADGQFLATHNEQSFRVTDYYRQLFTQLTPENEAPLLPGLVLALPDQNNQGEKLAFASIDQLSAEAESLVTSQDFFRQLHPDDLLKASETKTTSFLEIEAGEATENEVQTLIIIPGIAQEFFSTQVWQAHINNTGAFATAAIAAIQEAKATAPSFSLKAMGDVDKSLTDLFKFGSITVDGKEVVKLIYCDPAPASLESFRPLESLVPYFRERLQTLFKTIDTPENLYLTGHSMGANINLALLASLHADPTDADWYPNLKGMISLNGSLFGSDIANASIKEGTRFWQMRRLGDRLYDLKDNGLSRENLNLLLPLASELLEILEKTPKEMQWEGNINKINILAALGAVAPIGVELLADRESLYEKALFFYSEAMLAVDELTTPSRLAWWQNNEIPSHINYYQQISTMPGPVFSKREGAEKKGLLSHPMFRGDRFTYTILRNLYYDLWRFSGQRINDGLVAGSNGIFLPKYHQKLNPAQENYRVRTISIAGGDHTSTVMPKILSSAKSPVSIYPRKRFLISLSKVLQADQ
ncbi:MAG: hypothetical protein CMP10_21070 [Zetaproteobacteria bacterium]|nr:hypothetical protein [Pseudobdellovibrionaceae bacterium]